MDFVCLVVDTQDRVLRFENLHADTDPHAVDLAAEVRSRIGDGCGVELWRGGQLIVRRQEPDSPQRALTARPNFSRLRRREDREGH